MSNRHIYLLICFLFRFYCAAECHYYMAATGMRQLHKLETELVKSFLEYYDEETKKLDELEAMLNEYDSQNSAQGEGGYIYNPIDAYKLVKRFTRGWENITRLQRTEYKPSVMQNYTRLLHSSMGFHDTTEIWGSIFAIIKLQETYRMEVSEILNHPHSQTLELSDIATIGFYAMTNGFFAISALWLEEAYSRYYAGEDKYLGAYNISGLLETIIWDYYQINDYETAVHYSKELVKIEPNNDNARKKLLWYIYQTYNTQKPKKHDRFGSLTNRPWLERNNKLCRREEAMQQKDINRLFCTLHSPKPEFLLKPLQVEYMYHAPSIMYFHNILTESEIDLVVSKARQQVDSSIVFSLKTGKLVTANYRLSKTGWLNPDEHAIVRKLINRVSRITGLNMKYSEALQVANYGIGGNYESHFDHATPPHNSSIFGPFDWGNRVATMIFYLSDVEKGGETVFTTTASGVIITPKQGSALFWYNVKRNGSGDDRTKHAGCPIVTGEKWIGNLWIHEWGQEFVRPCSLNRND